MNHSQQVSCWASKLTPQLTTLQESEEAMHAASFSIFSLFCFYIYTKMPSLIINRQP